jgi:hypothetical protein
MNWLADRLLQHHRRFQAAFRKFVEEVIIPDAHAREEDGKRPSPQVFQEMAKLNIIAMRLGPGPHLKGLTLMGGIIKPEEFDHFHELIMGQEIARIHARGYGDGIGAGTFIGAFFGCRGQLTNRYYRPSCCYELRSP